jgi:hypothetical protein
MSKERPGKVELDPQAISGYAATFINRRDMYPLQLDNGTYVTVAKPLTDNLIYAHLLGKVSIGTYALDPKGWAKWVCFDADYDEHFAGLVSMAQALSLFSDVPTYLEPSRRGGHLWLFTPTLPGFQARRFGKQLLVDHELLEKHGEEQPGIELYPKQDRPTTGPGSLVRLPLGVHKLTGHRYHFITPDGSPLAPTIREQIQLLAAPARVPQAFIDQILSRAPVPKEVSPTQPFQVKLETDTSAPLSERIKSRISVYDFVSQYVALDKRGKGYCPFHDDQHKSFQVSQEGNYWQCYACQMGGSVIDFWMQWRGIHNQDSSFKETVKDLAKMLL